MFILFLNQVKEFKCLVIIFTSDEEWIRAMSSVMVLLQSAEVTNSVERQISQFTMFYDHEVWIVTLSMRSHIKAAKISFLNRVDGRNTQLIFIN